MKSSTRYVKPKSSLKDGGCITTPNDRIVHWNTAHLRQRPSFQWTKDQSCTNVQSHPSGAAQEAIAWVLFAPALLIMDGNSEEQKEFGEAKGALLAVQDSMDKKGC